MSLNLTAPDQPGEYLGTWMMKNEEGETFGLGDNAEYALWVNIVVPSPTATPSPPAPVAPAAPSNLQITSSVCDGGGLSVTLSWADNSDNEDGFRLYRDGGLVDTLGANSTSYNANAPHKNSAYTFEVEAFNGVGSSSKVSVNSQICPVP
jgi:hypothetical protein